MSNVDPHGLHSKFMVVRLDGSSAPGARHEGCAYFVLDLTHDPAAHVALAAYAAAVADEASAPGGKARPALADDLLDLVRRRRDQQVHEARRFPGAYVPRPDPDRP